MIVDTLVSSRKARRRSRPKKKVLEFRLILLILLVIVFFLSGIGLHLYLRHRAQKLTLQKEDLLLTNEILSKKIARLKSDPSAYEDVARQKYGLIKADERLIIFEKK